MSCSLFQSNVSRLFLLPQYDEANEAFFAALQGTSFELLLVDENEFNIGFGIENVFSYVIDRCC